MTNPAKEIPVKRDDMRQVIYSLIKEAPVVDGKHVIGACAVIVNGIPMQGALSWASADDPSMNETILRMVSPAPDGEMVEQFFRCHDVSVIGVRRAVTRKPVLFTG